MSDSLVHLFGDLVLRAAHREVDEQQEDDLRVRGNTRERAETAEMAVARRVKRGRPHRASGQPTPLKRVDGECVARRGVGRGVGRPD